MTQNRPIELALGKGLPAVRSPAGQKPSGTVRMFDEEDLPVLYEQETHPQRDGMAEAPAHAEEAVSDAQYKPVELLEHEEGLA